MELALHPLETKHLSWLLEIRNHETTRFQLGNDSIFTLEEAEKLLKLDHDKKHKHPESHSKASNDKTKSKKSKKTVKLAIKNKKIRKK